MRIKILDADTLGKDLDLSLFQEVGNVEIYGLTDSKETPERISDAEVLILNKVKLNGETLKYAKNLKLICVAATGFDNIDVEYCKNHGIAVCNVKGYSTDSVAQLTVSCALSLVLKLNLFNQYVRSGKYSENGIPNKVEPAFHELGSMTWGIVGYGNIGKKVSDVARAFGCKVLYFKRTKSDDADCVDLKTLARKSDIISVHLPLSDETRGIINKEIIEIMKENAILINMARGAVIDEEAVCKAVLDKKIAGFASDVYSTEPFSENSSYNKIKDLDNVILTPHMAWGSYEARVRCINEIKKNIISFSEGQKRNRIV